MRLTVIQSGTCAQDGRPNGTCYLLTGDEQAGGRHAIVDLGPGSLDRLALAGIDLGGVSAILLTHLHPDHAAELTAAIQTMVYGLAAPRREPLIIIGGPGIAGYLESLAKWQGDWILGRPDRFAIQVIEMEPGGRRSLLLGDEKMDVVAGGVCHAKSSLAYRFQVGGDLVITGDTGPCDSLVDFAAGAGCLVTECSFPDQDPVGGHMTPGVAADLAVRSAVSRLVLGHFYPAMDPAAALDQVSRIFSGPLWPALPGLEVLL